MNAILNTPGRVADSPCAAQLSHAGPPEQFKLVKERFAATPKERLLQNLDQSTLELYDIARNQITRRLVRFRVGHATFQLIRRQTGSTSHHAGGEAVVDRIEDSGDESGVRRCEVHDHLGKIIWVPPTALLRNHHLVDR